MSDKELYSSPLGQKTTYVETYNSSLLFPISRGPKREDIGINNQQLPFYGYDLWTAYELSWLNNKGKPVVAVADILIPCDSPNLIESKSLKLYLNSFNNSHFDSTETVVQTLVNDLSKSAGSPVNVTIFPPEHFSLSRIEDMNGFCLDELDVRCDEYQVNSSLLTIEGESVVNDYSVYSHLLKSNCPVTGQPDWGTLAITYSGPRINNDSLLKYIVSFRNHNEFHEQCVERIFTDLMTHCQAKELCVYARYTRRGGLDINPIRSSSYIAPPRNIRLYRQ
ncbi:NADPH-dependent 7-cyano-7-deazaguanine reductase QueF [Legionella jordanis]|uniref:NADPH-dependent 7-cyano-7-deazaguanine reductase n=1 Tax=Legionella jordanis TaxID=456 RepID=A0A0W0VFK5_9GAMM|nr:NADPH-dependent 7-cyano-7-deazaguanine reductase QueF [Legionella jordanis]KTD18926.1 GTP cyclohydrolase I PLUS perhaps regulatory protein [Legionella jordanis]RMX05510.1 NADPH-dependent 7-cyano-7-deazaguanine reductase QueF [Legionella jordanis]RMX19195.1 NADPH-dependent 7-cyano-7-deazaguanine reductase QueF [Legionella jordanis]VEH13026.1 7-cyano-7-deazaguanine reductase [Legionella jordanis]HAT8714069.1 NADPH-dependent 7-cyano-7-deazaguanine reductase QueF [Legionella jordanis]